MDIRLKSAIVTIAIIVIIALFIYAFNTFEIFAIIFSWVLLAFLVIVSVCIIYSFVYIILE